MASCCQKSPNTQNLKSAIISEISFFLVDFEAHAIPVAGHWGPKGQSDLCKLSGLSGGLMKGANRGYLHKSLQSSFQMKRVCDTEGVEVKHRRWLEWGQDAERQGWWGHGLFH